MAALVCVQSVTDVSVSAATTTTLIQLLAPTNQRIIIREISVSFKGQTNTNSPPWVKLVRQTTAGTASSGTPVAADDDLAETIQGTTKITYTVEPTSTLVLRVWDVHPQTGLIVPTNPVRPIIVKGGGRVGLQVNSTDAVVCSAYIEWEE